MRLSDLIQSDRRFADPETVITASVLRPGRVSSRLEPVESLLIFDTKKQRTWLVAGSDGLHCVIDRLDDPKPRQLWRIPAEVLVRNGRVSISLHAEPNSATTGKLFIDDKKPRLYSLRLFTDVPIDQRVRALVERVRPRPRN